jgi:hypothetical protein
MIGALTDSGPRLYFPGQIDEFMMWNRVLAAHEIRALYATGSPLGLLK